MKLLSLFSGCGGMDIGFEGGFSCLKKSVNEDIHPDWITEENGDWVTLRRTDFETVFADDIRPDAKTAWETYFRKKNIYHLESIVDIVKREKTGRKYCQKTLILSRAGSPVRISLLPEKGKGLNHRKAITGKK